MSRDVCEVCRVRPARWLDNPRIGRWRVLCHGCEVVPVPRLLLEEELERRYELEVSWS